MEHDPVHRSLPPRRDDVLDRLRVVGELRAADQPRRGRARQGLAAAQDAGRPLAAAGQPARLPRLHVGPPRQAAAVHGRRARPGVGVGRGPRARLVAARPPRAPRRAVAGARPQPGLPGDPGAVGAATPTPRRSQWIDANDASRNVFSFRAPRRPARRTWSASPTSPPSPHEDYRLGLPVGRHLGRGRSTPTPSPTPAPASATSAPSRPSRASTPACPAYADIQVPPLATVWFRKRLG